MFSHGQGAVFWRTHRVSAVAEIGPRLGHREDWAYVSYSCMLSTTDRWCTPLDIVIAGVFRTTDRVLPRWSDAFQEFLQGRILADGVRFLCGIFEVEKTQLTAVCSSCGASGPVPLCQPWQMKSAVADRLVTHPFYIIPFGRCTVQVVARGQTTEMPEWLAMHPSLFDARLLPEFPGDGAQPLHLRNLGKVKQKPADLQRWVPHIHQIMLFVGSSRSGAPCRARKEARLARREEQWQERGWRAHGSGWNDDRSRGWSVEHSGSAASSGYDGDERRQFWSGVFQPPDR